MSWLVHQSHFSVPCQPLRKDLHHLLMFADVLTYFKLKMAIWHIS
jgi:hypothetical protein